MPITTSQSGGSWRSRTIFTLCNSSLHFTRSLPHAWDFIIHNNNNRSNNSRCSRQRPQPGVHIPSHLIEGAKAPPILQMGTLRFWEAKLLIWKPQHVKNRLGFPSVGLHLCFSLKMPGKNILKNTKAFQRDSFLFCKVEHVINYRFQIKE